MERAIQAIAAEAGGLPSEQSALGARYLSYALSRFVGHDPSPEQVTAFLESFKLAVTFFRQAGEPPPEPEVKAGKLGLPEAFSPPVGRLCGVLFRAHEKRREAGDCLDAELLEHLELAWKAYDDGGGYCQGQEAVVIWMAYHAPLLFRIDPVWTQQRLFAHLAVGAVYRRAAAELLLGLVCSRPGPYLLSVRPYVFEFFEDLDAALGDNRDGRNHLLEWLHQIANQAFEEHDEATIAQITGLLRVMPETERGNFIGMLGRRFEELVPDDYEELSDRELHDILAARLGTPQFIRTFWPTDPQCQTGYTTASFIYLLFDAGEHAEDIFEVCRDFLVPIEDAKEQHLVHSMLAHSDPEVACVQSNPTIMAGIIDRTTNEHSLHAKELTELRQQLTTLPIHLAAP